MADKIKYICFLIFLPLIYSCASRKCCPDLFSWSRGKSTHAEFQYHIALSDNHKIYTLGGTNRGAFEVYDIRSRDWSQLPPIPTPVSFCSGVVLNHSIYLLGGIDSTLKYTDAFQKFDLKENKWVAMKSLTTKRSRTASVVCSGKIYWLGGLSGASDKSAKNSQQMDAYDPLSDTWINKSDMPTPRHGFAALTFRNRIIVAGGYSNEGATSVVEEYDPDTDQWKRLADLPFPNGFFGMAFLKNTIYAFGGRLRSEDSPIIKYDAEADQWTQVGSLPEIRNRFGIAADEQKVYIIGGEENPTSVWIGKKL